MFVNAAQLSRVEFAKVIVTATANAGPVCRVFSEVRSKPYQAVVDLEGLGLTTAMHHPS